MAYYILIVIQLRRVDTWTGPEGLLMFKDNLSLTSAYRWAKYSQTGHFAPRKETQYVLYRSLGGPQDRSERMRETSLYRP